VDLRDFFYKQVILTRFMRDVCTAIGQLHDGLMYSRTMTFKRLSAAHEFVEAVGLTSDPRTSLST